MRFNAYKVTKGIGTSRDMTAVRYPRRDVSKDRRVMCIHRSIDIRVMTSIVSTSIGVQVRKRQNTQKNVKRCSLKGILPNRHQNHCVSHHCHGGEKNDDHMTCHKNTVPFFSTFSSAHGTRNGEWRMERAKSRS